MVFFYTTQLFKNYVSEAEKLLDSWVSSGKPYFIYGAGEHSLFLNRNIKATSPFFLGFIDQSEAKQREGFLGKCVFSLTNALRLNPCGILVSSYEYHGEIIELIRKTAPDVDVPMIYDKNWHKETGKKQTAPPLNTRIFSNEKAGKRIAVIDTFFSWPPSGGSSVDLSELMNSLTLKGCEVTFFLPYLENKLYFPRGRIFSRDGLKFDINNIVFSQREFEEENFISTVGDAVDEYQPDYVFLGDIYAFKAPLLLRLKRYKTIWRSYNYDIVCPRMTLVDKRGLPCPLSFLKTPESCKECIRSDASLDWNHPIFSELRLAQLFSYKYHKKLLRALDETETIITYNDVLKGRLEKFLRQPEKIKIFPTGIFPQNFSADTDIDKTHDVTILLPGRAGDPVKGFPFYLEVFQKLRERYSNITLLITCRFDPGIEGVRSVGWLPLYEARSLYKMADFCVIPSLWEEPFGIVALEAMASEIPVIASSVGGLKGIVKDQRTGFLAPPGDFNAFYTLSEKLIVDSDLRDSLGREGAKESVKYSWERITNRYMSEVFI